MKTDQSIAVPYREIDRQAILKLARCSFVPGNFAKRFARDMQGRVLRKEETLTTRQLVRLYQLCYHYRRQIGDAAILEEALRYREAKAELRREKNHA